MKVINQTKSKEATTNPHFKFEDESTAKYFDKEMNSNDKHKIGLFVASLTFIGTIIGGGVVGLPLTFYYTGIPFGITMNLVCAFGSLYAVWLLIRARNITGLESYSELGFLCFGRASIFIINFLICLA